MQRFTRKCKPGRVAKWLKGSHPQPSKFRYTLYDIAFGVQSRIPPCCIAEFIWRGRFKGQYPAVEVGCFANGCGDYVHCWLHRCVIDTDVHQPQPPNQNYITRGENEWLTFQSSRRCSVSTVGNHRT